MATERLQVILQLAAGQYKREARQAATATGSIAKEAKSASTSVDKMGKSTSRVGSAVGKLGGVLVGAFAVNKIVDFAGDSIQAFSDLEQAVGGTEAVFGDASGAIDEFAKGSAQAIGLAESDFRVSTTLIGGQLKRMTGDVQFAAEQSIILTEVGADLAATYGGTTKQAVEALGSAFRGEADPAERFNLNLKIGVVNAKAVELGLAKSTSAVDDQARAQATLALIMEQSTDAQGQFAREADTIAGAQQRLAARTEDAKAAIGEGLLPVMLQLLELSEKLIPKARQLATVLGAFFASTDVDRWAVQSGLAAKSGELLAGSLAQVAEESRKTLGFGGIAELTDGFKDVIREGEFTDDALRKVRDGLDFLTEAGHLTGKEAEILAAILADELALSAQDVEDNMAGLEGELDAIRGGTEEAGDAAADAVGDLDALGAAADRQVGKWGDLITSMEDYETMIRRLTDPIFKHLDDQERLRGAQDDYTEAVEEFGDKSPEAIDAGFALAEAQLAVNSSAQDLPGVLQEGTDSIIILGQEAGISRDTLGGMRDVLNDLNGMRVDIEIAVRKTGAPIDPAVITGAETGFPIRHSGGPGRAGQPYVIRPKDEVFIPSGDGQFLLNDQVLKAFKGLSGGMTDNRQFNFPIQSTGNHNADAQLAGAVYSVIRRMETL